MEKIESIEDFYRNKLNWMPDNLKKEMGHFNVFSLEDCNNCRSGPVPYSRKDYFKITLIGGRNRVHYADKVVDIDGYALFFAHPMIPYYWESLDEEQTGFFCIFTEAFFNQFGNFKDYPIYQPGGNPVFPLDNGQASRVKGIYERMLTEIQSDYIYKYDVLRNLSFELIHMALKIQPAVTRPHGSSNASSRISSLFVELLERQFPVESPSQQIRLKAPLSFAAQLAIHVNHLNRALKETVGKTTSQLIAERITQEAKMLLKHTDWNISEIAWSLGFEELSNFTNFFKKHVTYTPGAFRSLVA